MTVYHAIVPHPTRRRVLLLADGAGWSLPRVEHAGGWVAYAVDALAQELSLKTGLELTFLRETCHQPVHVCEMENVARASALPPRRRWVGREEAAAEPALPEAQKGVLADWFARAGGAGRPRALWERRGWLAKAEGWIGRRLREQGIEPNGRLVKYKAAWDWSCILRVPTDAGPLYFKAGYAKPPAESRVIGLLARRWPARVPSVVASDAGRRWMLMRDFGGRPLTKEPFERWAGAVRAFAEMQAGGSRDVARLAAAGCPVRTPDALPEMFERVLAGLEANARGRPGRLDGADAALLRRRIGEYEALCRALADYGIPPSVVNEDFRAENVRAVGPGFVFYDWTDTVIAHPFFSMTRFLDFVRLEGAPAGGARAEALLLDSYLEPWTAYAPAASLREAFATARRLNPLYQAVRWDYERQFLAPDSVCGESNARALGRELKRCLTA